MSMSTIIYAAIGILILIVVIFLIYKAVGPANDEISCKGDGEECSETRDCANGGIPIPDSGCAKEKQLPKGEIAYCCKVL